MRQSRCKKIRVEASELYDKVKARGIKPAPVRMIERRLRKIRNQKRQAGQWGVEVKTPSRIAKFVSVDYLKDLSVADLVRKVEHESGRE